MSFVTGKLCTAAVGCAAAHVLNDFIEMLATAHVLNDFIAMLAILEVEEHDVQIC